MAASEEPFALRAEAAANGGIAEARTGAGGLSGGGRLPHEIESVPTERVPNPWGMKGNPRYHGRLVQEIAGDVDSRGLAVRVDYPVRNPAGDIVRRVDIAGLRNGVPVEFHQVGLVTRGGIPIGREWDALVDVYDLTGTWPEFHPYGISW